MRATGRRADAEDIGPDTEDGASSRLPASSDSGAADIADQPTRAPRSWSRGQRLGGFGIATFGSIVVAVTLVQANVALYTEDLASSWQLIALPELSADPFRSVWYLHTQPPLHNLMVGSVLRWSPFPPIGTLFALYLGSLWITALVLTDILAKWRVNPLLAGAFSAVALSNPNLLSTVAIASYEVPVTLLLIASIWWFQRHLQQPSVVSLLGLAITLTALTMTRSLFHPVFVVAVIGLAAVARKAQWRHLAIAVAIPLVCVGGWMIKNQVLFGEATMSSWVGFNLQRGVVATIDRTDVQAAVADGDVSSLALEYPWGQLSQYAEWNPGCRPSHRDPAVSEPVKYEKGSVVVANFNHECYLPLYAQAQDDAYALIARYPGQYLESRTTVVASSFAVTAIGTDEPAFASTAERSPRRTWLDDVGDVVLAPVKTTAQVQDWNLPLFGRAPVTFRISITLLLLAVGVLARSILAAVRLVRGRWSARDEMWDTDELVWLLLGLTGILVVVVGDLVEFGENGRFRSLLDPMLVAFPLGALARIITNRLGRADRPSTTP